MKSGPQRACKSHWKPEERLIGSVMMCISVVLPIGMLVGIMMGIQQDFTLASAHANLNLVGGVLLLLFGLYYRLVPTARRPRWRKYRTGSL